MSTATKYYDTSIVTNNIHIRLFFSLLDGEEPWSTWGGYQSRLQENYFDSYMGISLYMGTMRNYIDNATR